jgi:hypothetical protein
MRQIQFIESQNAVVELPGQAGRPASFGLELPAGTTQTSFVVRRTSPGAVMVRFVVTDTCGSWPTFVGGGPNAGF